MHIPLVQQLGMELLKSFFSSVMTYRISDLVTKAMLSYYHIEMKYSTSYNTVHVAVPRYFIMNVRFLEGFPLSASSEVNTGSAQDLSSYRIAGNLRGTKFLMITSFQLFANKILRYKLFHQ